MIIYLITNLVNNKKYIGQTVCSVELRWKRHCWDCTQNSHRMPISTAIKKYGKENFKIEVIDTCSNIDELNEKEIYWTNKLNTWSPNGYNLRAGNGKGTMSDEVKKKISIANIGKKRSNETKRKLSESHKGWVPSNTTKEKWRKAFKGKKQNPIHVEQRSELIRKTYTIVSPDGKIVTFKGLNKFCKENNLQHSKISLVLNGQRKHHKGWRKV